jgi:hypothetical protein
MTATNNQEQSEKPQASNPSNKSLPSWLPLSTFLAALLTPAAYLTGVSFHQSYLETFQIPYGLFPKASSDYFLFAYRAVMEAMPAWMNFLAKEHWPAVLIFLVLLYFSGFVKFARWIEKREFSKRTTERLRNNRAMKFISELLFVPAIGLAAIFYIPTATVILLVIPIYIGSTGGEKAAQSDLMRFQGGCSQPKDQKAFCTSIIDNGKPNGAGFVIDASEKYVALLDGEKLKVLKIDAIEFSSFGSIAAFTAADRTTQEAERQRADAATRDN